jgi:hypothetical protein
MGIILLFSTDTRELEVKLKEMLNQLFLKKLHKYRNKSKNKRRARPSIFNFSKISTSYLYPALTGEKVDKK